MNFLNWIMLLVSINISIANEISKPHVIEGTVYTGDKKENTTCEFKINGHMYKTQAKILPGRHFGLIQYDCGKEKGILVSKFKNCQNCLFLCPSNEGLIVCRSHFIAGGIGVLTGLSILILIGLIIFLIKKRWKRSYKIKNSSSEIINDNRSSLADVLNLVSISDKSVSLIVIVTFILVPLVLACDETLDIKSDGKICDKKECKNTQTILLTLVEGMAVCFVNDDKTVEKIELIEFKEIFEYEPIYYTSDYSLQMKAYSECKTVNSACWNPNTSGRCSDNVTHSPFKEKVKEVQSSDIIFGTTCAESAIGCDDWCSQKVSCTWILWWLESKSPIFTVYKKLHKSKHASLEISGSNELPYKLLLSLENPIVKAEGLKQQLSLISLNFEEEFTPGKLLLIGLNAYLMEGSELNQPIPYTLGDFQTQLKGNKSIYPMSNINCKAKGCRAICDHSSSFVSRFNLSMIKPIPVNK